MAWIKVEKNTPDKPEIRHVARACGVSIGEAFAAWFRLWTYFDGVTADGCVHLFTSDDCDDVAKLPGIGLALQDAGWVSFTPGGGLVVINWERHNGDGAKQRAQTAKRVASHRDRTGQDSGYRPWHKN